MMKMAKILFGFLIFFGAFGAAYKLQHVHRDIPASMMPGGDSLHQHEIMYNARRTDKVRVATCPMFGQNPRTTLRKRSTRNWLWGSIYESEKYVSVSDGKLGYDLFIPCSRNMKGGYEEVKYMMPSKQGQYMMGIPGMDLLNHKLRLPIRLQELKAEIFPPSYSVLSKTDMNRFYKDKFEYDHFILKSFKHLQKGLLVVKGKDGVREALREQNDYILLQPVISPDLLTDRHGKLTSLRIYVMIICSQENGMEVLYHPWLRVKYAGAKNSTDIATSSLLPGPSTLETFCQQEMCDTRHLIGLFEDLLKELFTKVRPEMCNAIPRDNRGVYFQLFGADVVINKKMDRAWLLEMNKGPNMAKEKTAKTQEGKRKVAGAFFRAAGLPMFEMDDRSDPMHYMIPLMTLPVEWAEPENEKAI